MDNKSIDTITELHAKELEFIKHKIKMKIQTTFGPNLGTRIPCDELMIDDLLEKVDECFDTVTGIGKSNKEVAK